MSALDAALVPAKASLLTGWWPRRRRRRSVADLLSRLHSLAPLRTALRARQRTRRRREAEIVRRVYWYGACCGLCVCVAVACNARVVLVVTRRAAEPAV